MIKKSFMAVALGLAFFVGTTACGGDQDSEATDATEVETTTEEHSHEGEEAHDHDHDHEAAATIYYCPMECEGDKTYEEVGSCPVCGMDLVEKA